MEQKDQKDETYGPLFDLPEWLRKHCRIDLDAEENHVVVVVSLGPIGIKLTLELEVFVEMLKGLVDRLGAEGEWAMVEGLVEHMAEREGFVDDVDPTGVLEDLRT